MSLFDGFAFSSQGYNHIKTGKECQDASGVLVNDLMSIIVVADGHGSDNYPRTKLGAEFAVGVATQSIECFVKNLNDSQEVFDYDDKQNVQLTDLAKNILLNWHSMVESDLEVNPFTDDELVNVSDKHKQMYMSEDTVSKAKAYGTTLIAICITPEYWFGIHLGDGKCISFNDKLVCSEPIPWDDDCQANITTSLCDSKAIDEFRFFKSRELPWAVFIGSDGIDDSYASETELQNLYRTIFLLFYEQDREKAKETVKEFLPGFSQNGSGDDVSIAGLVNTKLSKNAIEYLKAQIEYENAISACQKLDTECKIAEEKVSYIQTALQKNHEPISDEERLIKAKESFEAKLLEKSAAAERYQDAENKYDKAKRAFKSDCEESDSIEQ